MVSGDRLIPCCLCPRLKGLMSLEFNDWADSLGKGDGKGRSEPCFGTGPAMQVVCKGSRTETWQGVGYA